MTDDKVKIVPPAKVHGDSGVTAVVADIEGSKAEGTEATEHDQIPDDPKAQSAHTTDAGMRS